MRLTREERAAILRGEPATLTRTRQPLVEKGDEVVVTHSKPSAYCDPADGHVFRAPRQPEVWIEVTHVTRHRKGHWTIRYVVVDHRDPAILLAAGGGFTTDRSRAADQEVEAELTEQDRKRFATEARAKRAEDKRRSEEERRRQERRVQSQLREVLSGLSQQAAAELLATIERELDRSRVDEAA